MGRTAPRLPVHSSSNPAPDWSPTEDQFKELGTLLGDDSFPEDARVALIAACRRYLYWHRVEHDAGQQKEAHDVWNETRRRIAQIIELGDGAFPPFTEAGRLVEGFFFDGLESVSIQLTEWDIEPPSLDPQQSKGHISAVGLHLNITRNFMMRLADAFSVALKSTEREMANMGDGFSPGQALDRWLGDMRAWATKNNLPHGAGPGGGASRFTTFLFTLHRMMPANLREHVASATAMNERFRRHVRSHNGSNTSQER